MRKLIIGGSGGKMGSAVAQISSEYGFDVIAGFDFFSQKSYNFPVYDDPTSCLEKTDVIIDFSNPAALEGILNYACRTKTPVVIATTGYSESQMEFINTTSKVIPIFMSANMSIGINLLISLVKKCAGILYEDFDIEIIEKHHNKKADAPSGTALMLAEAINSSLPSKRELLYGRSPDTGRRSKDEIGMHSVRGGSIVGEHEIIFAGNDEVLELKHSVASREVFAVGALKAAKFILDKPCGIFSMDDLVGNL